MSRKTSFNELYTTLGAIVKSSTGRDWWKRIGIQAAPKIPYSIIHLTMGVGVQHPVVENVEIDKDVEPDTDEIYRQVPWNTTMLNCLVEFYRSSTNNSALDAATRFRSSLYLEERNWDLFKIAGLNGEVKITDISSIFRADTEPRAEVAFTISANIATPAPLANTDIYDIESQEIEVIHNRVDGEETTITVEIVDNE